MAKQFGELGDEHLAFIAGQRLFFAASATADSRINISPKGLDALRVIDRRTACYLDLTGSGAEAAAHLRLDGRLTLMFCAFEDPPLILRLYGRGESLVRGTSDYQDLLASAFGGVETPGARQIVRLDIELVQTSCGYGVPFFEYQGERDQLVRWAELTGEDGLNAYRRERNRRSIDDLETGLG